MGNFWNTMNKIGRTLEDIDDLAGDVKQKTLEAKYVYDIIRDSDEITSNDKIGHTLKDIDDVSGDGKQTTSTAKYGYGKVRDSALNFTNIPRNIEANLKQVEEFGIKKRKYRTKTIIFCVLVIAITVGICIFL